MFADPEFKEQAQVLAHNMHRDEEFQRELKGLNAALNAQQMSVTAEELDDVMSDPKFQEGQKRVSSALDSLMQDDDLQRQANSIAAYVESLKDSTQHWNEADTRPVSEQIAAMMANAKLRGMASEVVHEMLRKELKSTSLEWIAYLDSDELTSISEDPNVWEAIIEESQKPKEEAPQRSLLEVGEKYVQAVAYSPMALPSGSMQKLPTASLSSPAMQLRTGARMFVPQRTQRRPETVMNQEKLPQAGRGADSGANMFAEEPGCTIDAIYAGRCNEDSPKEGSALTSGESLQSMMPALVKALPDPPEGAITSSEGNTGKQKMSLFLCLALWYTGTFFYNVSNKRALEAAGGVAGFPMTIATLQLGIGAVYAVFMWMAPDARERPTISFKDYVGMLPLGFMGAGAQACSVFALSAGSVSFAQIVKASEPAFAAVIAVLLYGTKFSTAKWLTLIPVIGGVVLASLGELNFAFAALVAASLTNVFQALKANENSRLMQRPGISERIGSVGNQFAITVINSFLFMLPLMFVMEGHRLGEFVTLVKTDSLLQANLLLSGIWKYIYDSFATRVVKKTDAVTRSVASTAGRVVFLVAMAVVMHEIMSPLKIVGSGMAIGGVYLYSIIDSLVAARKAKQLRSSESAGDAKGNSVVVV
jgi:solute carrier family 35 protein E1